MERGLRLCHTGSVAALLEEGPARPQEGVMNAKTRASMTIVRLLCVPVDRRPPGHLTTAASPDTSERAARPGGDAR